MRTFQKRFVDFVRSPNQFEIFDDLVPGGKLSLKSALEIHSNGYIARLTESLGETFEGVWWVLGDSEFFKTCARFIRQNSSQNYNLSDIGKKFPEFLNSEVDDRAPFLADLARFEWLFNECFHSSKPIEFDHAELHVLHQHSNVSIRLQSNMRLFSAPYSVYPIWKMRSERAENVGQFDWDKPEHLFIFKRDQSLFVQALEPSSFYLLELMSQGLSLNETIDRTALLFGDLQEEQVSQLFGDLIKTGVIAGIQPGSPTSARPKG